MLATFLRLSHKRNFSGVYVPRIYLHARLDLSQAIRIFLCSCDVFGTLTLFPLFVESQELDKNHSNDEVRRFARQLV